MTKLIGPLFSLDARGTIADTLVYAKIGHTSYSKKWAKPANPRSAAQTAVRRIIPVVTRAWATLTDEHREWWAERAHDLQTSNYHAYLRENTQRWTRDQLPAAYALLFESADAEYNNSYWSLTDETYTIHVEIGGVPWDPFALQVAVDPDPDFTPSRFNTIALNTTWTIMDEMFHFPEFTYVRPFSAPHYFKYRWTSFIGAEQPWIDLPEYSEE